MTDQTISTLTKVHDYTADKLLKFFGGLFMEQKEQTDGSYKWVSSLGRVAFWIVFGHMMYVFGTGGTLAGQEENVFYALLGYQGVKLGKDTLTGTVSVWKGGQVNGKPASNNGADAAV